MVNAIWPDAVEQGKVAALNILGDFTRYSGAIPRNVIDIFGTPVFFIGNHVGEKVTFSSLSGVKRYTK